MRKYYLDNLRWLCVLLVLPCHVFLCYTASYTYYVQAPQQITVLAWLGELCLLWLMPLLFLVSGVSAAYALRTRSPEAFLRERVNKLLIPFCSGVVLLVPVLTFYARTFHQGYAGGFWANYAYFLTHWGEASPGVHAFEMGQMWFLLFLFLVTAAALPLLLRLGRLHVNLSLSALSSRGLALLFVPVWLLGSLLPTAPMRISESFVLFLMGALFFHEEALQNRLEACRWRFFVPFAALSVLFVVADGPAPLPAILHDGVRVFLMWLGILAMLGLGKRYFNQNNALTRYLSRTSFAIYLFHQSWLTAMAWWVLGSVPCAPLQIFLLLAGSLLCSVLSCELARRVAPLRRLFGIKR